MKEYHKIQTVFLRDPETKFKTLLDGQFSRPEFEYLQDNLWWFTEKVDGTNIRIHWTGEKIMFAGRTGRANIPKPLIKRLGEMFFFTPNNIFSDLPPLCLYGEGYGAKIQKGGGDYIPDGVSFILFDIKIGDVWLERSNVEDIAQKLNIDVVPILGEGKLLDGVEMVRAGCPSKLRHTPPEGLVMRPKVELVSRRGERLITKIKAKDFPQSRPSLSTKAR